MKMKLSDKIKQHQFKYKEEFWEEIKNNSIVLSFAISIIIIGIISIFYHNSSTLLIGIAISSLMLTLIQCFSNGNTILNILPILTLLLFGFFQKSIESIPVVNLLLKAQYANFIIFLSFSLTFLTQAFKNIIFKHKINDAYIQYNEDKNKMIYAELEVIKNIKEKVNNLENVVNNKEIDYDKYHKIMGELLEYVEDESFISHVKSTLITKGSEEKKVTFNIEEVEESIVLNSGVTRNREINATNLLEDKNL